MWVCIKMRRSTDGGGTNGEMDQFMRGSFVVIGSKFIVDNNRHGRGVIIYEGRKAITGRWENNRLVEVWQS